MSQPKSLPNHLTFILPAPPKAFDSNCLSPLLKGLDPLNNHSWHSYYTDELIFDEREITRVVKAYTSTPLYSELNKFLRGEYYVYDPHGLPREFYEQNYDIPHKQDASPISVNKAGTLLKAADIMKKAIYGSDKLNCPRLYRAFQKAKGFAIFAQSNGFPQSEELLEIITNIKDRKIAKNEGMQKIVDILNGGGPIKLTESGFSSTTTNEAFASDFADYQVPIVLQITTPGEIFGKKILSHEQRSEYGEENEVILPPGAEFSINDAHLEEKIISGCSQLVIVIDVDYTEKEVNSNYIVRARKYCVKDRSLNYKQREQRAIIMASQNSIGKGRKVAEAPKRSVSTEFGGKNKAKKYTKTIVSSKAPVALGLS